VTSCFIKRVVPFALAFLCGVAVWQLAGVGTQALSDVFYFEYETAPRSVVRGNFSHARTDGEQSRTWLVILSSPAVESVRPEGLDCERCSVRMRVQFGEDGVAVPGNGFSLSPAAYPLIEDAVAATRSISFTPASMDGRAIPLWANVTYECGYDARPSRRQSCRLLVDKHSARTWNGRPWHVITAYE
jgi:hypothetical protein